MITQVVREETATFMPRQDRSVLKSQGTQHFNDERFFPSPSQKEKSDYLW